jgi:hypothetical protein
MRNVLNLRQGTFAFSKVTGEESKAIQLLPMSLIIGPATIHRSFYMGKSRVDFGDGESMRNSRRIDSKKTLL